MTIIRTRVICSMFACFISVASAEEDKIVLEKTVIKGNSELPKLLYVVPWRDISGESKPDEQKLVLHSLFGDLYDPLVPQGPAISASEEK